MNIYDIIKNRNSVRSYLDKGIDDNLLKKIFDTARFAPSASNRQEWRFVVVKSMEKRKKLCEAARGQKFVKEAPVVVACCAKTDNHKMSCGQLCYPIDLSIIIDHITLLAVEEGLGTCWVGAFFEDQVKDILDIPSDIRVVELLTIGYPKDDSFKVKNRLGLSDIVKYEKW